MPITVELVSDAPVTDEACLAATGKTLTQWSSELGEQTFRNRREATVWLWDQVGRSPAQAWWGITIWVEHERRTGKLQKDGRMEGYGICSTKTVKAPVEKVQEALLRAMDGAEIVRVRDGKDVRAKWTTPGIEGFTEVDAALAPQDGKVGITLNHTRIQTREEADGLRRAWSDALAQVKSECEAS